jgi:DNA mismatch repair protein MutL
MAPIKRLSAEVAATIAAGEVIERPSSVVKELVENSLDAAATKITIDLADGGKAMIRVEDNGAGIPASELPLAVESFSTSKIAAADDISRVRTLGFRGEALASIRAVSSFTIRSCAKGSEVGRELIFRGDSLLSDTPVVRNAGTEIVVEHLFFNLPARRKFLRSASSELRRILGIIQAYALAFPETAFALGEGGRDVAFYASSGLRERVEAVIGAEIFKHLIPVEGTVGRLRIHGFVSLPDLTRANRYLQFSFINRRFARDRILSHALNQAYQSLVPGDRFPVIVCFVEVPPEEIDINVHPAKAEIRFRNESEVHHAVATTVRAGLEGKSRPYREAVESVYRSIFPGGAGERFDPVAPGAASIRMGESASAEPPRTAIDAGSPVEPFESPLSLFSEEATGIGPTAGALYWQLHQSYILIQIRGGMVIVDQHAAHERILFDRAKRSLAGDRPPVQSLLFPATLELAPAEYERLEELSDTLEGLGFEIEPFGLRSIIVRAIPAGVRNWGDGRLIEEMLGDAGTHGVDEFLKTYACRAAIKAGTRLAPEEMESLADQLFAADHPYTCPHGRPTMLRVDTADLERRFQRTVSARK